MRRFAFILIFLAAALCVYAAQSVKTVNGLAIASVKTVDQLAIASVKTVNGLDNTSSGVTTDYANPGGTGERNSIILASSSASCLASDKVMTLINGANGTDTWFTAGALSGSVYLRWDFGIERVIDEAKFYQSSATAQGTWKWQGSDDASSWTDIGSSFAIAASATQTLTELNGNTTAYRYYQMVGVSGSTNGGPYVYEMEFKVEAAPASSTSWTDALSYGDRQATITETTTVTWNGTFSKIIDGDTTESTHWMSSGATSGLYIRFDFGSGKFIDQVKWYQSSAIAQGIWKWQGSDDASSWTDVSNPFYLGFAATQTVYLSLANATSYRYWQMIGVSGNASSGSYQREAEFKISP